MKLLYDQFGKDLKLGEKEEREKLTGPQVTNQLLASLSKKAATSKEAVDQVYNRLLLQVKGKPIVTQILPAAIEALLEEERQSKEDHQEKAVTDEIKKSRIAKEKELAAAK